MATNSNEKRFTFRPRFNDWLISYSHDPGLDLTMKQNHAQTTENKGKLYWTIAPEFFDNVKNILISAGYSEFINNNNNTTVNYSIKPCPAPLGTLENAYSVKQISELVQNVIKKQFNLPIWISGEILDLKCHQSQAYYFDLAETWLDEKGTPKQYKLSTKIWSNVAKHIDAQIQTGQLLPLQNGNKIRAWGTIDYYPINGTISFIIREIDAHFAEGEILKKKEVIVQKLKEMGLLVQNQKLPMPYLPLRIALISSQTAAGRDDLINQLNKKAFPFKITFFPTLMQGQGLEASVLSSLHAIEKIGFDQFDIAIITRGGGSFLDLAWFNSQPIAEFIARCPLKFLIGIGHNRDSSVLDAIATSFPTPTAIADTLNEHLQRIDDTLTQAAHNLALVAHNRLQIEDQTLQTIAAQCAQYLSERRRIASTELSRLETSLRQATQSRMHADEVRFQNFASDIKLHSMQIQNEKICQLDQLVQKIQLAKTSLLQKERNFLKQEAVSIIQKTEFARQNQHSELNRLREIIHHLNPITLLQRGFTTLSDGSGKRITSIQGIAPNDQLSIRLIDGKLSVCVKTAQPIPSSDLPHDENEG